MVKHGHNKKRRAGRIGRTKLKNRSFNRWDPKPKISNETIRNNWDPSKSPSINLANMGLVSQPNFKTPPPQGSSSSSSAAVDDDKKKKIHIELFDIPDSDELGPKKAKRIPLNQDEQEYIAKCMSKYGENYQKMFRDIKLNTMQHTEDKLRKMGARFLLLDPNQRYVPIPTNITTSTK